VQHDRARGRIKDNTGTLSYIYLLITSLVSIVSRGLANYLLYIKNLKKVKLGLTPFAAHLHLLLRVST